MAADLSLHDAVLDEAALRFAAGDALGAAQALSDALDRSDLAPEAAQSLHDTLLDLCCAMGDAQRFEVLALEGARRFQASPPTWCHLPQALADWRASLGAGALSGPVGAHWQAPLCLRTLDLPTVRGDALSAKSWVLDWSRFGGMEPAAVPALMACLQAWADAPTTLVMLGGERMDGWFDQALREPAASPALWLLHLAWLRLSARADAFEAQALAYCQRFEQSPPAWAPPGCTLLTEDGVLSLVPGAHGAGDLPRLWGEVLGDALPRLAALNDAVQPSGPLRIDCALLLRLDFTAAGALLNWAAARQAAGCTPALWHLHRPVARLLQLLGVEAHASLHLRR